MSQGLHFSLTRLGKLRKVQPTDLDTLLNLCPSLALVIDTANLGILLANRAVLELTGYELDELSAQSIQFILPDWKPGLPQGIVDQQELDIFISKGKRLLLKSKNLVKIPVQVINWSYSGDRKRLFLVLELEQTSVIAPDSESQRYGSQNHPSGELSKREIGELLKALQSTDLNGALNQILSAAQVLTGASSLAVYAKGPNPAIMVRHVRHGQSDWLPDKLPTQELIHLKTPQIWQTGRRPTADLHHAAQASHLAYAASLPFGNLKQVNPMVMGMLILAGYDELPKDGLLQTGQAIALLIAAVMQKADLENQYLNILRSSDQVKTLENVLQENITEGFLLLSPGLDILDINTAAETILGYDRLEVRGQPVENVLIGTETLLEELHKVSERQNIRTPLGGQIYRRTGEAIVVKILLLPITTQDKLDNILILIQDLSEQEHAREQAHQLEQRAMLGEIMAVFAHEVRNPINNISTGLELMALNLPADDPNHPTIIRLLQDCDRLAELMKSVLAYSRPAEYTMSRVQLEPFFQNLLDRLRPRMERLNIQGSLQIAPDCPPITGSPRALEQVFINLINNALQAMSDSGGQLMINIQPAQEENLPVVDARDHSSLKLEHSRYVEVNVIDTGPGIPQEIQERIFQPFYTTDFSGTGLGLAIAKRILTAHRGNISVTSFPGGTVFRVFLPASD
jgi:two-component system, NtrC family, sensor histidine kinase AtoS